MQRIKQLIQLIQALRQFVPLDAAIALAQVIFPLPATDADVDPWLDGIKPPVSEILKHYLPGPTGAVVASATSATEIDDALEHMGVAADERAVFAAALQRMVA